MAVFSNRPFRFEKGFAAAVYPAKFRRTAHHIQTGRLAVQKTNNQMKFHMSGASDRKRSQSDQERNLCIPTLEHGNEDSCFIQIRSWQDVTNTGVEISNPNLLKIPSEAKAGNL